MTNNNTLAAAYNEGHTAYYNHVKRQDNRFQYAGKQDEARAWDRGWADAYRAHMEKVGIR